MSLNGRIAAPAGLPPSEAVAVVAAVEAFLADTAPDAAPDPPPANPWQRAALKDGIAARQISGYGWGSPVPR